MTTTFRAGRSALLLLVAGFAVLAAGAAPSQSAFPGTNGVIAFTLSGGDSRIEVVRADGTGLRAVTPRSLHDVSQPSWSADGRRLAVVARGAVWRLSPSSGALTRITRASVVDPQTPGFSPTGKRIVFASRTRGSNYDIRVANIDGRGVRRLTSSPLIDEHPSWSPDGRRIAFTRAKAAPNFELWVMRSDGSAQRRLASGRDPDWSPDGRSIAFARGQELWVMRADGTRATQVTTGPGMSAEPEWSPDGRWIVFWNDRASGEATKGDLYVVHPNGTGLRRLTNAPQLWHFNPSWQPRVKPAR